RVRELVKLGRQANAFRTAKFTSKFRDEGRIVQKRQPRRVEPLFQREFRRQCVDLFIKFLRGAPNLKLLTLGLQFSVGNAGRGGGCYRHLISKTAKRARGTRTPNIPLGKRAPLPIGLPPHWGSIEMLPLVL